jgi:VCBS repeat-containing protein
MTLSNGSGSCEIAFTAPGSHRVTATYSGDSRFAGSSDDDNHQVTATPNLAPVTQPDEYSTNEDTPLSVSAGAGVLRNDQDPEGGPLTASNASNPPNGSVTLDTDGSFTYTPDADFFGDDSFTYQAKDQAGNATTGTVTIHVTAVNDPPSFTLDGTNLNANVGESYTVPNWAVDISSGPNEGGQALDFVVSTDHPEFFTAVPSISPEGTLTFTASASGTSTVTVQLHDNGGGTDTSAPQSFTITSGVDIAAPQAP